MAAAEVDQKFDAHRLELAVQSQPPLKELSNAQIKRLGEIYYAFRLEEDEETRLEGFYEADGCQPDLPAPFFNEYEEDIRTMDELTRHGYARGKIDVFFMDEAKELLTWDNVNLRLDNNSSVRKLA